MNYSLQKNFSSALIFLFSISLFSGTMLWADNAEAHKGHAGKKTAFIKNKEALKAMLPTGGKVYRRKQGLNSEQLDWANKNYGIDLSSKVIPFYVSKDRATNAEIGSAIIYKFTYRHGNSEVAIGLNKENKITTTAFVSVNEKYIVDFEATVGKGVIKSFDGMTVDDLTNYANKNDKADKATREFANALRDAAITLVAFKQK